MLNPQILRHLLGIFISLDVRKSILGFSDPQVALEILGYRQTSLNIQIVLKF